MENEKNQKVIAKQIKAQYTEKAHSKVDELMALDRKVHLPATIFTYIFGIIGSLILGTGMCFAMNVIEPGKYLGFINISENMMLPGIVIGIIGIIAVSINYPLYSKLLNSRKNKYSAEIIKLSDEILNK